MYLNQRTHKVVPKSTSGEPIPVVTPQTHSETAQIAESENASEADLSVGNLPSHQSESCAQPRIQSRFLSQRHQPTTITPERYSRGKNFFENTLITSKICITDLGCEFMIDGDDPVSLTRRIRSYISPKHGNHVSSENTRKFLDGLKEAFSLIGNAFNDSQKFLTGFIMREDGKKYHSNTSLIQCLFAIPTLMDEVANLLLANLLRYAIDSGENASAFIVGLVVIQFKFGDQLFTSVTNNKVYNMFFEILKELQNDDCRGIIIASFRDFDELKHDDAVNRILTIYQDDITLLSTFIETFAEMRISADTKTQISQIVLYSIRNKVREPKLLLVTVKSLFHFMESPEIIVKILREDLKWNTYRTVACDEQKLKVILFLQKSLRGEKSKMLEAWIGAVTRLEDPKDLKPIDFVMLLVIVDVNEEKFSLIKRIIVQKLTRGFFNTDFMKNVFNMFPDNIAYYSNTLLEVLNALQKNNVYEISEFNSTCFKELFAVESSDKKEIVGSLVQFLCRKTQDTSFSSYSNLKTTVLAILDDMRKFNQSSAVALLVNRKLLMRCLDISKVKLSFNEYRLIFDLLCLLAFATNFAGSVIEQLNLVEQQEELQEELNMITDKMSYNPDYKIKLVGIIGGIKVIGCQVLNIKPNMIDVRAENVAQNAAIKLDRILSSVEGNPLGFAFICDELAIEFRTKGKDFVINELFVADVGAVMLKKLTKLAISLVDTKLPQVNGAELVHRYHATSNLIGPEVNKSLAVNLGSLVFYNGTPDVIAAAALFNLMKSSIQQHLHSLETIYNFAIMPITVTNTFGLPEDELSLSDDQLSNKKLDLYFHCINWLREMIGTYCHWTNESKEMLQEIVVQRVKQLIQMEKRVNELLEEAPSSYYPPLTTFQDEDIKKKAFDIMRKVKAAANKTRKKNNQAAVSSALAEPINATIKIRQFCRDLDPEVKVMLSHTFKYRSEEIPEDEFGLEELLFLLDDLWNKVKVACACQSAERQGFYNPIQAISDLTNSVLLDLAKIFDNINHKFSEMNFQAITDCSDVVFYTKDANILKACFCLILGIFDALLTCPQLKFERNSGLLQQVLKLIANNAELIECNQEDLCSCIINRGNSLERNVKSCDCAVALLKVMKAVCKFSSTDGDDLRDVVTDLCEKFLAEEWKDSNGQGEKGAVFNANLEKLLLMYVEDADLKLISLYVQKMSIDFKRIISSETTHQSTFPSFTKVNSSSMVKAYLTRVSQILSTTQSDGMDAEFWMKCVKLFNLFADIVKCIASENIYIAYLKQSIIFIRAFNDSGIKGLKGIVKKRKDFVILVESVQTITRFVHSLSCELKHKKNNSVGFIIPKLRESMMKNYQAISCLLPLTSIDESEVTKMKLTNHGLDLEDIPSQNFTGSPAMSENGSDNEAEKSVDDLDVNIDDEADEQMEC